MNIRKGYVTVRPHGITPATRVCIRAWSSDWDQYKPMDIAIVCDAAAADKHIRELQSLLDVHGCEVIETDDKRQDA